MKLFGESVFLKVAEDLQDPSKMSKMGFKIKTAQDASEPTQDKSCADDCNEAHDHMSADNAKPEEQKMAADSFSTALKSLLTASKALDDEGFEVYATDTLKIASLIVEAKKKKMDKKDKDADKEKESKDKKKDLKDSKKDPKSKGKKDKDADKEKPFGKKDKSEK